MLFALADFARADGSHVFPTHRRLAARAHYTVRWTRIVLQRLVARGWVLLERAGSGRSRARYRLTIPTLSPLPRPCSANDLASFPQTFPQVVHRGDQSILSRGDRSILSEGIDRSHRHPPEPPAGATAWAVEDSPIRPLPVPKDHPSLKEATLPLEEDDAALRARVLDDLRLKMARAGVLPTARAAAS